MTETGTHTPAPPFWLSALLFLLLRLIWIEADPIALDFSLSSFGDPGYYAMNARSWALFGRWTDCLWLVTPIFPGYQLPLAFWFRLAGDGLVSLRLFHLTVHGLGALGTVLAVRRLWGAPAARWCAFLWAINWTAIAGCRNAWVENMLVGWLGLGFAAIVCLPPLAAGFASGLAYALALVTKPYLLCFLPGPAWAQGRDRRRWSGFISALILVLPAYAAGWWIFHQALPAAHAATFDGMFVGREQTRLLDLLLRCIAFPQVFAINFFARSAVETVLAAGGLVWLLARGSRTWSPGERWLLGGLLGLTGLFVILDYRPIRYYLLAFTVMMPLAGLMAAQGIEGLHAALENAPSWRRRLAGAIGLGILALAAIFSGLASLLDWRPLCPLGFGMTLVLWAGLVAAAPALLRPAARLSPRAWCALLLLASLILAGAQFGAWCRTRTFHFATAGKRLATLHPPGKVFGWLGPMLALGTPHEVYWDWGKPDTPEYYRRYGCRYWWRTARDTATPPGARELERLPCLIGGRAMEIVVYDLEADSSGRSATP